MCVCAKIIVPSSAGAASGERFDSVIIIYFVTAIWKRIIFAHNDFFSNFQLSLLRFVLFCNLYLSFSLSIDEFMTHDTQTYLQTIAIITMEMKYKKSVGDGGDYDDNKTLTHTHTISIRFGSPLFVNTFFSLTNYFYVIFSCCCCWIHYYYNLFVKCMCLCVCESSSEWVCLVSIFDSIS